MGFRTLLFGVALVVAGAATAEPRFIRLKAQLKGREAKRIVQWAKER